MIIRIKFLNEAFNNGKYASQERLWIKQLSRFVYFKLQNLINDSTLSIQAFFGKGMAYKPQIEPMQDERFRPDVLFVVDIEKSNVPDIAIHGTSGKDDNGTFIHIKAQLNLTESEQNNREYFKNMSPSIVEEIYEIVSHELTHIKQYMDKNEKERISGSSGEVYTKQKMEIEAFTRGFVTAYQKSNYKYKISFAQFVINNTLNRMRYFEGHIDRAIEFAQDILNLVQKQYPKINLSDKDIVLSKFSNALSKNPKMKTHLIRPR